MKIIATIFTIIATLLFIIISYLLSNDSIGYSSKDGIHIFNFFICFTIPIILWIVYYLNSNKTKIIFPLRIKKISKNNVYYIQENGETSPPLTYDELCTKKIKRDTFVWRKGIDWIKAGELRELEGIFIDNSPPPFNLENPPPFEESNKNLDGLNEGNHLDENDYTFFTILIMIVVFFTIIIYIVNYLH